MFMMKINFNLTLNNLFPKEKKIRLKDILETRQKNKIY